MKEYTVYMHIAPNGKRYIGITSQQPEVRWKNGHGYADNPYFFGAIQKYGWENFEHTIVATGLKKECAEEMEISLISAFRSSDRNTGYNIAPGGCINTHAEETREKIKRAAARTWADDRKREKLCEAMRGVKRSETARANISKAQRIRFQNPEERAKISAVQIGKTRTEAAKKKTSESLKKYYESPENREAHRKAHEGVNRKNRARAVVCIETGEFFEAVCDAEQKFGIDHRNIVAVCRGKRKHAGGYSWRYAQDEVV